MTDSFRGIDLKELLGRPARKLSPDAARGVVTDRRILVTGAGGSIGGELTRRIIPFGPARLLLIDHSEYALYEIDRDIRARGAGNAEVVSRLADVKDGPALAALLKNFRPEIVFHAAAYKHVHLVEENPLAAILNNVRGTRNLLDASLDAGVKIFAQISSDKAVKPAGIMGATKRVCELMTTTAGRRTGRQWFSVRVGNVLGSSGSLLPLLLAQLESNLPLTITHKDMSRYFILASEAAHFLIVSAVPAQAGEIVILKMGEPVKIMEIVRRLIELKGRGKDEVPIVFTGIRPGEKISEELIGRGEKIEREGPDMIFLRPEAEESSERIERGVAEAISLAEAGDPRAVAALKALVEVEKA